jgi:alpha-beta hydrolase superfamily lysophospholipase
VKLYFDDPDFDGQLQRSMAKVVEGCADAGEVIATGAAIAAGDVGSWYQAWWNTAERVRDIADAAERAGHATSAREAYLRASEYYRAGYYYRRSDITDARMLKAWRAARDSFRSALPHFVRYGEILTVPYEGHDLPGYFFAPDGSGVKRPTILTFPGYDAPAEEMYPYLVAPATRRGYSVFLFEGPGQGGALYEQGLVFRPDWEAVVTPALDFLLQRSDVERDKVVLFGRSWGGYLAPRAASKEHRFAAVVADPGLFDLGEALATALGDLHGRVLAGDADAEATAENLLKDSRRAEYFESRMATHGVRTVSEYIRLMQQYRLEDVVGEIATPFLVTDAENEAIGQGKQLYDALTAPKEFLFFTDAEGASGHCEGMGQALFNQRVYDWLDGVVGVGAPG